MNRRLAFVLVISLLLPAAWAPRAAAQDAPDFDLKAPYADSFTSGVGVADPLTGTVLIATPPADEPITVNAGPGEDVSSEAAIVAAHFLSQSVQYVHYEARVQLAGNAFFTEGATPCGWGWWCYAWSAVYAKAYASIDSCPDCTSHSTIWLASASSYSTLFAANLPSEITVRVTLRNPTGDLVPPGTVRVAVSLYTLSTPTQVQAYTGCVLEEWCPSWLECLFFGYPCFPDAYISESLVTAAATVLGVRGRISNDPMDLPDLAVTQMGTVPARPEYGLDLQVWYDITNLGGARSSLTLLYWPGWHYSGYLYSWLGPLDPGQTVRVSDWVRAGVPGLQTRTMVVDPFDEVTEHKETNNAGVNTFEVLNCTKCADLSVKSITTNPSPASEGWLRLRAVVENAGNAPVQGYGYVNFYVDGAYLAYLYIFDLDAGQTRNMELWWGPTQGTYDIRIEVDEGNRVPESDETNNRGEAQIVVGPYNPPDLAVVSFSETASQVREGDAVTFTAVVKNVGGGQSAEFPSHIALWDPLHGYDWGEGTMSDGLAPGETITVTRTVRPEAGNYTVYGWADAGNWVQEPDDNGDPPSNNVAELTLVVTPVPRPDLEVTQVLVPDSPTAGQDLAITATVLNSGPGSGGSFGAALIVDGSRVADASVSSLGAGQEKSVTFHWTAVEGTHSLYVVADYDGQVLEEDDYNNGREVFVNVAPAPVRGVDLSPASQSNTVALRGTVTYDVVVTNAGSAADTIQLTKSANAGGWKATLSQSSVQLGAGQSVVVKLTVTAPSKASTFSVTVTGTSQADSSKSDSSVAETTSKK